MFENYGVIWNKNQCTEASDEILMIMAMSSFADLEGEKIYQKNQDYSQDSRFALTPQKEKMIRRLFDKQKRKKRMATIYKTTGVVIRRVAIVVLVISIGFYSTLAVSADFRYSLYKLVLKDEVRYTEIFPNDLHHADFIDAEIYEGFEKVYALTYIPSGYELSDHTLHSSEDGNLLFGSVVYRNPNDDTYYNFYQSFHTSDKSGLQVDTENAEVVKTITIGESEALYSEKTYDDGVKITMITWPVGNAILSVMTDASSEEIIKIAESIKLLS